MTTTTLCLIRHGETSWNAERRLQGHTDIPLNTRGMLQARQMAQALKNINLTFDVLYTSDLKRASDTANAGVETFPVGAQGIDSASNGLDIAQSAAQGGTCLLYTSDAADE